MIGLSSTASEFSLLDGLAHTAIALPGLFDQLNTLAAFVDIQGFTDTHQAPIDTLGEASAAWLAVASALTLATQTQAEVCRRLKESEAEWVAEFDLVRAQDGPLNPKQRDLHEQFMSHGLLLEGFIGVFRGHIQALDRWVTKAIPALSLLSAYMQRWHDKLAERDPMALGGLPWRGLLIHLYHTAMHLDPTAGEWLAYKDVRQALTAVSRAGHLLLVAPVTAAQHATDDLGMLAKVLEDSADQLKTMHPEQPSDVYQRRLTFALLSCDKARLHCESLLALMDKNGAK